jgi:hypothetical protein
LGSINTTWMGTSADIRQLSKGEDGDRWCKRWPIVGNTHRDKERPYKACIRTRPQLDFGVTIRYQITSLSYKHTWGILIDLYSIRKASQFRRNLEQPLSSFFPDWKTRNCICTIVRSVQAVTWRYRLHLALAHTRLLLTAALNDVSTIGWEGAARCPTGSTWCRCLRGRHKLQKRTNVQVRAHLFWLHTRCRAPSWRSTSAPALVIIHTSDIVSTVWEVIYRSHDECWRRRNGFWWAQIRYLGWFDSVTSLYPDMNNAILNLKFKF